MIAVAKASLSLKYSSIGFRLLLSVGLLLEVVEEDSQGAGLLTEVGDDSAAGPDGLLHLAVGIELGESAPGTEVLAAVDHDDGDLALGAEGADELLVLLVLAVLGEAAEAGRAAVEGLGALVKALAEAVVNEGLLEDLRAVIKVGEGEMP